MNYQFSLVLPIQNHDEIIELVVKNINKVLKQAKIDYEILMVENGSIDKTLQVLKKLARQNKRNKVLVSKPGYAEAIVYGLNRAKGKYVCYMDADGQCDEKVLLKVIKAIQKPGVDLIKVFRANRESVLRKNISLNFNLLANLMFVLKAKDINASPTCFVRTNLKKLDIQAKDSFIDTELMIKANHLKWKIVRIPMKNFNRAGGESTVKPGLILEFLKNMFEWKFGNKFSQWVKTLK